MNEFQNESFAASPTIWITVGQGPTALAVGAGGVVWTFLLSSILSSPLSPSLWETARYRLKYCLKGPLNPKQPTNQSKSSHLKDTTYRVIQYMYMLTKRLAYEVPKGRHYRYLHVILHNMCTGTVLIESVMCIQIYLYRHRLLCPFP